MDLVETSNARRSTGGRANRVAMRASPRTGSASPIRGGFNSGRYNPLTDSEVAQIHEASLDVLQNIGIGDCIEPWRELICKHGGWVNEQNRLCYPRELVKRAIAVAGRNFTLYGRDPRHDMTISGSRVYFGGGSATVKVLDPKTRKFRETGIQDVYDYSRLEDTLDNMHFVIRQCIANDLPVARELDLNTAYAVMSGTSKHMVTSYFQPAHLKEVVRMFDMSLGGEGRFRERPFAHGIIVIALSPLRFSPEGCQVITAAVEEGMPALLATAPQSGATSPAALAGSLVQGHAESLAALVYVNLLKPGHPVLLGNWQFVSDLRTGSFIGGGGEFALLSAASAQLARYLDLPCGVAGGISDSKLPDAQSGWEKGFLTTMPGLAGGNLIYESTGALASLIASSYESFVIDNDMLGNVLRAIRGIEVNERTISIDVMKRVVEGPNHYLGDDQTLQLMETEYLYPKLADRQSIGAWQSEGSTDICERASIVVRKTLSEHFPRHIDDETDAKIRDSFDIKLRRDLMRPGEGRWYGQ